MRGRMGANVDAEEPLNIDDYEPPHEQVGPDANGTAPNGPGPGPAAGGPCAVAPRFAFVALTQIGSAQGRGTVALWCL